MSGSATETEASLASRLLERYLPRPVKEWIDAQPLGRRLARGAFWTLAGAVAARVFRIPVSIVLARVMGSKHYGELGIAVASIDLFGIFASFGLGMTATKFVAELRVKDPARAGRIIAISSIAASLLAGILSTVLYFISPWLASHTLAAPHLTLSLRIGALVLFFTSLNGAQAGALYGFEAFQVSARLQAIIGVLDLPFMLGGYFLGGLNGVLYGMAASRLTNWAMMRQALIGEMRHHGIVLQFRDWQRELPVFWHFCLPAALGGILVVPVNWICSAILVNQPSGYVEMGAYNVANQWYNSLMMLPTLLGSALLPILSERLGARDHASTEHAMMVMVKLNAVTMIPCALVMSVLSPYIMRIYGASYSTAWPTLVAALWTAAILAIILPVGDVIAASGKMWLGFAMNAGWAAIFIGSTMLLVRWGSLGLASSRLVSYAVHAVWTLVFAYMTLAKRPSSELVLVENETEAVS